MKNRILTAASIAILCTAASGCHNVDDERIPYAGVRIVFRSQGEWVTWGVGGAGQTRSFIIQERIPAGFPYTVTSMTGFGGVLIVGDYDGQYRAYDMACPVERRSTVRIQPITDEGEPRAECPVCHSSYDIFRYGGPLSGPAATNRYGLTHYYIAPGLNGEFMTVTN